MSQRPEQWGTRLGFILATMGSAVGLGNVWRFPTATVQGGGGAFIVLYLVNILLVGVPVMIAELVLGRASQRNVVSTFSSLRPDTRWWGAGVISLTAAFVILSFYAVIAGWTLLYLLSGLFGVTTGADPQGLEALFVSITANTTLALFGTGWFLLVTLTVVVVGVTRGIERWNRLLMPGIVMLLAVLMVRTLFLPGAMQGVMWLLRPDPSLLTVKTGLDALGQVFFSFSLGMGAVLTYGSYLPRTENIPGSAVLISIADLGVALLAALIVIPALFVFGIEPGVGPGLLFITMPAVFNSMPLSQLWTVLFFLTLVSAALSSSVSMMEVVVAYLVDDLKISRWTAAMAVGTAAFVVGIPAALSGGVLSQARIGSFTPLDGMDFLASNILLPLGGFFTVVFVAWIWGSNRAEAELGLGAPGTRLIRVWSIVVRFLIPVAIAYVFIAGLLG